MLQSVSESVEFVATADSLFRFFGLALVFFALPVLVIRFGKEGLIALLPIYLVTANLFAKSFFTLCLINGTPILMNLAVPIYGACFVVTDLLSEFYSKSDARRAVWTGFLGQAVLVFSLWVVGGANLESVEIYGQTFDFLFRLTAGSFIAYLTSNMLDISIYHAILNKTGRRKLWIRNNLSTIISQAVDTAIFLGIAFWGVAPVETPAKWMVFATATWLFKVLVAASDTAALYAARGLYYKKQ